MTSRLIAAALTAAIGLAAVATPAAAQQWRWSEGNWRTVGSARVDGRDSDTIRLPGFTRQREIRVCAIGAPLRLRDFDVRFANGGRQDVRTRAILEAGTCTRAVDLRGNRRDVEAVRLRYEPVAPRANRPIVRVQVR